MERGQAGGEGSLTAWAAGKRGAVQGAGTGMERAGERVWETALAAAEMAPRPAWLLVAASAASAAARTGAAFPSRPVPVVRPDRVSLVHSWGMRSRWFYFLARRLALLCTAAARLSGDAVSMPRARAPRAACAWARGAVTRLGLAPTAEHGGKGNAG